ncbi:MAG: cyclic pyranopterin monophosphate synthase MoaC [Candidatus Eremiobacteraeota bacterium]|nr:cyclic pyranopterin monophosphate synthase MoaC [Candidatus Eremiobacteraeota bacterium]
MSAGRPSHIRPDGGLTMVDVGSKDASERFARARASIRMGEAAERALKDATLAKGDALVAAQIAGIMAAKKTADLIPLAHPLPLANVSVEFRWSAPGVLDVEASASTNAQTGVEMEALTAAAVAALTIYDMTKAVEKDIVIESLRLVEKRGGKSGHWSAR